MRRVDDFESLKKVKLEWKTFFFFFLFQSLHKTKAFSTGSDAADDDEEEEFKDAGEFVDLLLCCCSTDKGFLMGDELMRGLRKHSLQAAMYLSVPPITSTSLDCTIRLEKAASRKQIMHTAVSFITTSASGTSSSTLPNGLRWNVPSSADTITILPMFAGKTTELIRRLNRYKIAQKRVLFIKYKKDTRYSEENMATHDQ